jgi:hypothetical protein
LERFFYLKNCANKSPNMEPSGELMAGMGEVPPVLPIPLSSPVGNIVFLALPKRKCSQASVSMESKIFEENKTKQNRHQ